MVIYPSSNKYLAFLEARKRLSVAVQKDTKTLLSTFAYTRHLSQKEHIKRLGKVSRKFPKTKQSIIIGYIFKAQEKKFFLLLFVLKLRRQ